METTKNSLAGFISPELVYLNCSYTTQDAFFSDSYQKLYKQGFVEATYHQNILVREAHYPTGLITSCLNIAIPHTDPLYIKKPFVAITQLTKPLTFLLMGSTDEKVDVDWIFSLGVTRDENQIVLLQTLMSVFSDENKISQLVGLDSREGICEFFHSL